MRDRSVADRRLVRLTQANFSSPYGHDPQTSQREAHAMEIDCGWIRRRLERASLTGHRNAVTICPPDLEHPLWQQSGDAVRFRRDWPCNIVMHTTNDKFANIALLPFDNRTAVAFSAGTLYGRLDCALPRLFSPVTEQRQSQEACTASSNAPLAVGAVRFLFAGKGHGQLPDERSHTL